MDCLESTNSSSTTSVHYYKLLLQGATMIPMTHLFIGLACIFSATLYYVLEIHLFQDLFHGGSAVTLTYNPSSNVYRDVVSKCSILHARYRATFWLSSPHFQTMLLEFVAKPPKFSYKREIFLSSDGGSFALDWLMSSDVLHSEKKNGIIWEKDTTPIVVVIPGLTSDSTSAYIRLLVHSTAIRGWNVVVCNHRGMGGVPFTSDRAYSSGWTTDVRDVLNHLHQKFPEAPLFAVGTSIGANILVKYLGEYGKTVPLVGAAAVSSPWDLLIGSRYIARKLVQNLYGIILTMGLKSYAKSNQTHFKRLADWEGIMKSRHMPEFDKALTCTMENFETADTFYRWCSSAAYTRDVSVPLLSISSLDDPVCTAEAIPWHECRANKNIVLATTKHGGHLGFFEGITAPSLCCIQPGELNSESSVPKTADTFYRWCSSAAYTRDVSVPLLSISSLDDPVCTAEAIPWHECRANKNIVLATTKHGGHLGFFEGITAPSLWWVRAVNEFLTVLHSTSMQKHNKTNVTKEAMVSAACKRPTIIGKVEISREATKALKM